ncbi:MAG: RsmB/NOP family class I SAM-dependent RNA methyltransferase [Synergistaceae bacterium]|nr:RsmB/NOP family class I SAM-dependent RNA methyltransferase [Synergistaceae bacterium]
MRGIEAALHVWEQVRSGKFASESIRRVADLLPPGDLVLASSLVYLSMRRQFLWKEISGSFLKTSPRGLSRIAEDALCIGTAGILELRTFAPRVLVNGLVQELKKAGDERGSRIVNAVLRRVVTEGPAKMKRIGESGGLKEQSLYCGVPSWVASEWRNAWGDEGKKLLKMMLIRPYSSFRVNSAADREKILSDAREKGIRCWQSPFTPSSLRLAGTIFPLRFPGYSEGIATPQNESSILVAEVIKKLYRGGPILEMCSGRGIKTAQLASLLHDAPLEGIELSPAKARAAEKELNRTGHKGRIKIAVGDALKVAPLSEPAMISLDAPCSGSGTWNRRPEAKWRLIPEKLDSLASLQVNLLKRAVSLLAPGGIVVYSTCSLLKKENENVVAAVLSDDPDLVELSFPFSGPFFRRGRPWGTYIWPELPWLDGFYMAAIMKKSGGKAVDG